MLFENSEISYMDYRLPKGYIPPKRKRQLEGDELLAYLKYSREKYDQRMEKGRNRHLDQLFHPYLRLILKFSRIISGIKVVKANVKLPDVPDNRPIIYTITHVGKDDQAVFNELKTKHYSVLSGDYESLYNNIEGFFTKANGVLFFDMNSRKERKEVIGRVARKLSEDNILCSMEAAWNISPNCLVYCLFPGMIQSALLSNAVIVPVGIERFSSKLFGINVSDTYFDSAREISCFQSEKEFLEWAKDYIRQELASLKFSLYFDDRIREKITCKRSEMGDYAQYMKWFISDVLNGWTFTEEDIFRKRYKHPLEPELVFGRYFR